MSLLSPVAVTPKRSSDRRTPAGFVSACTRFTKSRMIAERLLGSGSFANFSVMWTGKRT